MADPQGSVGEKIADDVKVNSCGRLGIITTLEFLQHLFAKLGHGDLLFP